MISLDESIERDAFVPVASTAPSVATLPEDWNPYESTLESPVAG